MATTGALEEAKIHKLFGCISGKYAQRNQAMLMIGIARALRATELVSFNVGDVFDSNGILYPIKL